MLNHGPNLHHYSIRMVKRYQIIFLKSKEIFPEQVYSKMIADKQIYRENRYIQELNSEQPLNGNSGFEKSVGTKSSEDTNNR
jgi:hypothetical protein